MKNSLKKQQGAETLEFLIVFLMFLMLLMAVFECARALYVWNALVEATRRGARMAIVCPTDSASQDIVRRVATFDTVNAGTALGTSPVVKGLTPGAFDIDYYDASGNSVTDPVANIDSIAFVSVELNENYSFTFIIPAFSYPVDNMPGFKTTLYAESKGAFPYYPGTVPIPSASCNF